jgi:hypothetical protein
MVEAGGCRGYSSDNEFFKQRIIQVEAFFANNNIGGVSIGLRFARVALHGSRTPFTRSVDNRWGVLSRFFSRRA